MGFTFIATGNTIMSGYYARDYDGYKEPTSLIASADVAMNNMEMPLAGAGRDLAEATRHCKPYGTEVTTDAQGLFVFRKSLT